MVNDTTAAFVRRSNEAWRDAHAPDEQLSVSTRRVCLFDAGYFALLARATAEARKRVAHHPDAEFIRSECACCSLASEPATQFVAAEHSPDAEGLPTHAMLRRWAADVRARLI